ncbi:LysE family translocator [Agrobacterium vitis]|uniref:LysE family translocator n=1 Tax=Agrobacterium vitis TaxID=373 RepID=A0A7K1RNH1_AGRVI|nr:LysE family translocator [Agrobacterium vitis]MVA59576.1 LysE family translocator [Agrobacterium vitis]
MTIIFDTLLAVTLYSVPMIISPGPGNTILATAGAKFGVRGTAQFLIGFECANFIWCIVYGFGLSTVLALHPEVSQVLKWLGVAYTLYLAYTFIKSSSVTTQSDIKKLNAFDGFLSVTLNPKIHQMIFVLFSQFLPGNDASLGEVYQIAFLFTALCILCHVPWIVAGKVLFSSMNSASAIKIQGYIFAGCMVLVAAYVAIH